jgi:putative nucleotidyltransferase with HDIG domain
MANIPTAEECISMLIRHRVPDNIIRHSVQVARVAVWICDLANSKDEAMLLTPLAEAASLLHDIAKMDAIKNGGEHALMGQTIVEQAGYHEVADIVRQHVRLDKPVSEFENITEAMVVFYADKRVKHDEIVSIRVRYDDLLERYGSTNKRIRRIRYMYQETARIEQKISDFLDYPALSTSCPSGRIKEIYQNYMEK